MSDVRWRIELVKAGLLGLWKNDLKEKEKVTAIVNIHFIQSPLSPFLLLFNPEKRRGRFLIFYRSVQRFLSIRIITAPTTEIAMTMPTMPGTIYRSAVDACGGVGEAVAAGASVTDM